MFEQRHTKKDVNQFILCLYKGRRRKKGPKHQGASGYALIALVFLFVYSFQVHSQSHIRKKHEIEGGISPKSVVSSGTGLFAAQNMMYRHTITIYDKAGNLLAKIKDGVNLRNFGFNEYESGTYLGAPVEAVFSNKGRYLWVSNYCMSGDGFDNPGCDACNGSSYDPGFVYKINTQTYSIENVIKVGAVPKYMSLSKDEKRLLVSNWSSGDVSVIDTETEKEIKRVYVGAHPRGIDITKDRKRAYVTVMGSTKLAVIDLRTYEVNYIKDMGNSPRHVVLSENDSLLYIAVNSSNMVVKYRVCDGKKEVCKTKAGPRTMILSPNQMFLYVVNYYSNTFTKIRTDSMKVVEVVETGNHPIGITANWDDAEIWVACYTGKIEIFKDFQLEKMNEKGIFDWDLDLAAYFPYFSVDDETEKETEQEFATLPEESKEDIAARTQNEPSEIKDVDRTYKEAVVKDTIVVETIAEVETPVVKEKPLENITKPLEKEEKPVEESNIPGCSYHIIVGSFSVYENASNYKQKMINKGYAAQLLDSNKGLTYVSVQCFSSREAANSGLAGVMDKTGVKGWVLKR